MKKAQYLMLEVTIKNEQVLRENTLTRVLVLSLDIYLTLTGNSLHASATDILTIICTFKGSTILVY